MRSKRGRKVDNPRNTKRKKNKTLHPKVRSTRLGLLAVHL